MAKNEATTKRVLLDKANVTIVIVVAVACFVSIFALTASKSLFSQMLYQNRVISKKEDAKKQLTSSISARDQLVSQYKLFVQSPTNIIGGSTAGTSDRDGDNAKIVLDALPSKYDYPALTSSLEKLMSGSGLTISGITGTDDEINQASVTSAQVVDMPFTLSFAGDYKNTEEFMKTLDRSIRPIQVQKLTFAGSDNNLSTTVVAKTFFQPAKTFEVKKETVK